MASFDRELALELHRAVVTTRSFLKPRWPALQRAYGVPAITPDGGTCLVSSAFLQLLLKDKGIDAQRRYGAGQNRAGFFNGREWCDHAWLETAGFIVDCTAGQFGKGEKFLKPATDSRYQSERGVALLDDKRNRFLQRWRQQWIEAKGANEELVAILPVTPPARALKALRK